MKHTAIINLDAPGHKINRHIYGHFAEHLGHCIYDGFYVGEDSDIPNIHGLRLDLIEAFKNLNIPNLRWPGGCFADEYHWQDGIGPKSGRPEMINTHWGGVIENNHFGTHEFMELCELLGTEPYITGNLGSGSVHEMSQWIEYLTFDGISPMADLRAQNGRDKPWNVKYWGVGNENWGCGGGMSPEFYAENARRYSTYCRNYGSNQLFKIVCGPNVDDYNWMDVVMNKLTDSSNFPDRFMKGISLHYYTMQGGWEHKGTALDSDLDHWVELMAKSWNADKLLYRHKTIMDRWDPEKKIGLIFDEWGTWHQVEPNTNPGFLYQQNTIRDALVAAMHLDIFHKHADRLYMANLAQAVNVLQAPVLTRGKQLVLTPTYHILEMNKEHMDAENLPLFVDLKDFYMDYQGQKISSLSLSASRKNESYLLSVSNLDPEKSALVTVELRGESINKVKSRILTAPKLDSHNDFGHPNEVVPVEFKDFTLKEEILTIKLPPRAFATFMMS